VVELDEHIVGGGGLQAVDNESVKTCELQKLYFLPQARGLGIGKTLLQKILETAQAFGFKQCYLESFDNMHAAIGLYEKQGFKPINHTMGNTGHSACGVWMLKKF